MSSSTIWRPYLDEPSSPSEGHIPALTPGWPLPVPPNFLALVALARYQNLPLLSLPLPQKSEDIVKHRCPQCKECFNSTATLASHFNRHHNSAERRSPNSSCRCHVCGKAFSRHWLLQGHLRTHTGEKPFRCPKCPKAFADKSNMRAHVQTHSGVKPWPCDRCGKAFALRSYLVKHRESACAGPLYHSIAMRRV